MFDNPSTDAGLFNFSVDETAKGHLLETARWAKFLSIVGFVTIALLILAGLFASMIMGSLGGTIGSGMPAGAMMAIYIVFGALYFFPTYYLFKFSSLIKPALLGANQQDFNSALSYLRKAFRFIGIVTLVILGIYALIIIFGIIGVAMR